MEPSKRRRLVALSGLWMILAPAAVVAGGFCVWILWAGMDRHSMPYTGSPPLPPPPAPAAVAPGNPPAAHAGPVEIHCLRSRDEVLLLVRRRRYGIPATEAAVAVFDGEGGVRKEGRTDGSGVYRGSLPEGAAGVQVSFEGEEVRALLPPAPEPLPPDLPFLLDRSVIRPGDRVRLLLLARDGAPPPAPGCLLLDAGDEPVEAVGLAPAEDPAVEEPWALFEGTVPDDAPPGSARISAGETLLATVPVVPRWGGGAADAGASPDRPPPPPGGALRFREGQWHLAVPGAEPGGVVLFAAISGDRLLSHGAVAVERGEAAFTLPVPVDDAPVVVRAVAMTSSGFLASEAAVPSGDGGARMEIRTDPDGGGATVLLRPAGDLPAEAAGPSAAVAAAAADPTGRRPFTVIAAAASADRLSIAWESPGERWQDYRGPAGEVVFTRPTVGIPARVRAVAAGGGLSAVLRDAWSPRGDGARAPRLLHLEHGSIGFDEEGSVSVGRWRPAVASVLLVPGRAASWPGRGRTPAASPPNTPGDAVEWRVDAPGEVSGPFRVTAGGAIVIEGVIEPEGEEEDGRTGTVGARLLARGPLAMESRIPGLRGLLLEGPCLPAPADAPPDGEGIAIERSFPARGRVGTEAEAVVLLRAAAAVPGPVVVELPLPGATAPAEDGFAIRARAPRGTRVSIPRDAEWGVAETVVWRLPGLAAGETRLTVRLRFDARGDYAAPAATADSLDPTGPWGRSGAGRVDIE